MNCFTERSNDNKRTWDSVEVDLSEVKTVEGLHAELKEALELPDYYGGNLDALHDCLTDIAASATEADPVTIIFTNYKSARRALGSDFYNFRNVLNDVSDEYPNFIVEWRRKA